ncbi:MAG: efflux transporter outer membrane subunit [Xanthobacteraceae bacterium]
MSALRRGIDRIRRGVRGGLRSAPQAKSRFALFGLAVSLELAACTVGPDYARAPAPVPEKFKELKGWKVATPSDTVERGAWWSIYKDTALNGLARQIEISNQTVAASAAAYEQARAVIREAQAGLFPTVTANYSVTRSHSGAAVGGGGVATTTTTYNPQANAAWTLDVWGSIRRQIEANTSAAQVSAADLANAKLSAQAQLAIAYFNLRAADSLRMLLDKTAKEYKRTLEITEHQYCPGATLTKDRHCPAGGPGGIVTRADVIAAETQLFNVQAMAINVEVQRAQFEHAIAMLIGKPPAELTLARRALANSIPNIPVTIPSSLLERRPDIAAAERTMQQQNALIGVAVAAFYPTISLSGLVGFSGSRPLPFNVANEVWSLGAAAAQTVFDGGLRSADLDAARAVYWESVANYRQTVLIAFQGVEDELSAIRVSTQALKVQLQAVKAAREAVDVYLNQYQAGIVAFTTVVTAQATLLADEQLALTYKQNLFIASVTLIEDLGGLWDTSLLPTQAEMQEAFSLLPQL